jgi:hypothetical protein
MELKKLSRFAILCLAVITLPFIITSCNSFSETEYAIVGEGLTFDNYIYDQYENSTVRITGIENMPSHLVIPEKINGMTVVEIADEAFAYSKTLLYLELPKGSIKLGKGFCAGSEALICVNLSGSVSIIPEIAFEGCINLTLLDGMRGITAIESQAFAGCSSLTSLSFPETLTSVGSEAFRGCTALTSITLPSSVTSVGESAFWGCSGIAKADLLCSADIPEYCFLDCNTLTSVRTGDSVTAIKEEAFRNCRSLYSVEIGAACKTIGGYAFHACDSLTEIRFTDKNGIAIGEGNESLCESN